MMSEEKFFKIVGDDISDGYHTFDELYAHRNELFIALCRLLVYEYETHSYKPVWRSVKHADGSQYEGWFVLGIDEKFGKQITYHLPIELWENTKFARTLDHAPIWDGHTSADVLIRLRGLI